MAKKKKLYEYNVKFSVSGKEARVQQSAFNFEDAKKRIKRKYSGASNFKLLKRMSYPHKIG